MTTPQAISKILKNAEFKMSVVRNGRVASYRLPGVHVQKDYMGRVVVCVAHKESWNESQRMESRSAKLATRASVIEFLQSRGYSIQESDVYPDGIIVSK